MKKLNTLLEEYIPAYEEEILYKSRMLDFINNYDNVFSRKQIFGHFTASSLLLNSDSSKFLLMHHKKLNRWMQLGGHCDEDEDVLAVSIKEAMEESGINEIVHLSDKIFDIDIHTIPSNSKEAEHFHFDIRFLLKTDGNDHFIKNEESNDLKWVLFEGFNPSEYSLENSVIRMIQKHSIPLQRLI